MKMKSYHAVIVLAVLIVSAIATSVNSYRRMQSDIEYDLDRALAITLHERNDQWLTPDTIYDYRSHLSIDFLKKTSLLCYVVDDRHNRLSATRNDRQLLTSKTMTLHSHAVRGYANCSFADVFGMSDQRMPFSFALLSVLWGIAMLYRYRRQPITSSSEVVSGALDQQEDCFAGHVSCTLGTLSYLNDEDCFYNHVSQQVVRFTPMQHQLMRMFFANKLHQLSKQDICATLWPKKPNANETLYTLIRRMKPIVENNDLTIESERGMAYTLREHTAD